MSDYMKLKQEQSTNHKNDLSGVIVTSLFAWLSVMNCVNQ